MQPMPNTVYPPEFWSIASEAIPLLLAGWPSDTSLLTQAALVSMLIALHLWSAALGGHPAVPDYPTGDEMATLWGSHHSVLWWAAVEVHAERVAGADPELLDLDTPDGRALRIVVSEWLEVQWVEIDWAEMEQAAQQCGQIWFATRFMLLRGVIRRASQGSDIEDPPPF